MKDIHECYKRIGLKQTDWAEAKILDCKGEKFCSRGSEKDCKRFEEKTNHYPITSPLTPLVDF